MPIRHAVPFDFSKFSRAPAARTLAPALALSLFPFSYTSIVTRRPSRACIGATGRASANNKSRMEVGALLLDSGASVLLYFAHQRRREDSLREKGQAGTYQPEAKNRGDTLGCCENCFGKQEAFFSR